MAVFIALLASISPFFVWPIEQLLPYPYVIEEIVKGALVLGYRYTRGRSFSPFLAAFVVSIPFSISETIFYTTNLLLSNSLSSLFTRLFLVTLMHFLTTLITAASLKYNQKLIPLGLIGAGLIHYFFNGAGLR